MKKNIIIFCTLLFLSPVLASAQPIILGLVDSGHYLNVSTSPIGVETDTVATVKMSTAVFPTFSPHVNYNWDLTNLSYTGTHVVKFTAATSPYQNSDSEVYSAGPLNYSAFNDNFFVMTGWQSHAQHIDTQTVVIKRAHDSTMIAFSFVDNLLFMPGTTNSLAYNIHLPFPTTYNTSWSSDYYFKHLFNIKDSNPALNDTTFKSGGYHYEHATESSQVVGYGLMKIKQKDSTASRLIHVLQIQKTKHYYDSIVLPSTVSSHLRDSLGLSNSYTHDVYSVEFRTSQLLSPLAKIIFTDSSMTVVASAEINVGNLSKIDDSTASVSVVTNSGNKMLVYPNPAIGGQVFIEMPGAKAGNWYCELYNVSGQLMSRNSMQLGSGNDKARISLPSDIAGGMYFISVTLDGKKEATTPLLISK